MVGSLKGALKKVLKGEILCEKYHLFSYYIHFDRLYKYATFSKETL